MSDHYEGWGEHHAYRCGKDDGFTDGYFAAVEACIAAVEALRGLTDDELLAPRALPETNEEWVSKARILVALREVQP